MKTLQTLFLFLASLLSLFPHPAAAQSAAAYAVADAATGHLLATSHAEKKLQIGSLTKIATLMVVLDWADLSKSDLGTMATVPPAAVAIAGANPIGFQPGDQLSLRDLIYAAILQSDNVAAYTLAMHVGRALGQTKPGVAPVELFVAQMNALARKLGMQHTKFLNPHGLDYVEQPYSSAHDLVRLSSYAMKRAAFRFYVSQKDRRIARHLANGEQAGYNLANTNELLGINDIDGVKTGSTSRAGECLVISAARSPEAQQNADGSVTVTPRRLIVVVLGATKRFDTGFALLNNGWNLYDQWAAAGRPLEKHE
ncbi:MAG: serine hydrolase [Verrucomicrobiota bacterium]